MSIVGCRRAWRRRRGRRAPARVWQYRRAPWDWYGQVCPGPRIAGRRSEEQVSHMKEGLEDWGWGVGGWTRGRGEERRGEERRGERMCGREGVSGNRAMTQRWRAFCLVAGWFFIRVFSPWLRLREISRGCVQGLGVESPSETRQHVWNLHYGCKKGSW